MNITLCRTADADLALRHFFSALVGKDVALRPTAKDGVFDLVSGAYTPAEVVAVDSWTQGQKPCGIDITGVHGPRGRWLDAWTSPLLSRRRRL